jgi:hypothetical protein
MTLELTATQVAALTELLDATLANMSVEIRHTDSRAFRERLVERRDTLRELHSRLLVVPVA